MLFSGLTLNRVAVGQRFAQNAPLAQLFNPLYSKSRAVAAQFNEIVSEGPKSAWGTPLRRRPSGYNFLLFLRNSCVRAFAVRPGLASGKGIICAYGLRAHASIRGQEKRSG